MKHVLCALFVFAAPAAAQTNAIVLFLDGGRTAGLLSLSTDGDQIGGGFALGGGAGIQLGPATALRAGIRHVRTDYAGEALALADQGMGRSYIGAELQTGWPGSGVLVPYVFLGGGLVRTIPDDPAQSVTSNVAGRLGAGVNWLGSPLVLFVEADTWTYRFTGLGFQRIQIDVLARVGLAVPFAF